jgi:hypothetical protein
VISRIAACSGGCLAIAVGKIHEAATVIDAICQVAAAGMSPGLRRENKKNKREKCEYENIWGVLFHFTMQPKQELDSCKMLP